MDLNSVESRLYVDPSYFSEICKDNALLYKAIETYRSNDVHSRLVFNSPLTVLYIINNKNLVDEIVFREAKKKILSSTELARTKIGVNSTFLVELMKNDILLNDIEKIFVLSEVSVYENEKNSLVARKLHGMGAYDLSYYILINSSFNEEEKKKLISRFFLSDGVCINRFMDYINLFYSNPVNSGLSYYDLFNYSYQNLLDYYQDSNVASDNYRIIRSLDLIRNNPPSVIERESVKKLEKTN